MYLRKAWHYNKLFFTLVVLFIIGQAFVTYNRGMVFSPFYNYSMYASPIRHADSIKVLEMYVGGKPLDPALFSTRDWDKLTISYQYAMDPTRNNWVISEISRLTGNAGLVWPVDAYQHPLGRDEMAKRWRKLFLRVSNAGVDSVQWITYQRWKGKWVSK